MSKCRSCGEPAVVDLPRHNANFCSVHLQQLCTRQVERAISDHSMFAPEDRILVAVSGGKDSLALWDMLIELGYRADGLYIGLGIGEYSEESHRITAEFADTRGLTLHTVDLRAEHGFDIPTAARATKRVPCSACGLSKRHIFDRETRRHGYDVLATGHNLDDEAAVLLGNTIRWDVDYLSRQSPVLPERHGFPRKVKPLIRLTEREMAAWCVVRGIDYVVEECPMAIGNRHAGLKETLNAMDERSPGTKASFYLGFLDRMAPLLRERPDAEAAPEACPSCGSPSSSDGMPCSFCRLEENAGSHEPVPVRMVLNRVARRAFDAQWGRRAQMTEGDRGFAVGERVMLLDSKRRRYLVELVADGEFHSHAGYVAHSSIIGSAEGTVVESTKGAEYVVLRPTLEDFVLEMPRGAQVIYPKDLAPILMLADIAPGVRVFESGLGSGALSTAMLRAGAEVTGYEVREDFANRARINVRSFLGEGALERYHVSVADSYAGIDESLGPFDRVVLDLPEPWQVVPHAERVLRPGGILLAYTPSITQASQTRESLRGRWIENRTIEVLHRGWHVEGQAVRPDHRMVAHTGFLTLARFLGRSAERIARDG